MMVVSDKQEYELRAHLLRRAGFGSSKKELQHYMRNSYEDTVEYLLKPNFNDWMGDHLVRRFDPEASGMINAPGASRNWLYRMISTANPLTEKIPLLWHSIFATGVPKVINGRVLFDQINMLRKYGTGRLDDLLLQLSRDPAMIVWLDNQENHKDAMNENWGRELLELFSMGVGNYTEEDVKECARAFTGWTIGNTEYMMVRAKRDSDWPYGRIAYHFQYREDDHDTSERTFLGQTGNFNGDDIIRIICEQESTARFISRHLYHFFVADEVPVPSWGTVEPRDPKAIDQLVKAYFDSNHNITDMLRVLFNSDFFKSSDVRYQKVKGPAEFASTVIKLSGQFEIPDREMIPKYQQIVWMGQELSNPSSVEGWHEGKEWVDTGTLVERINFASEQLGDYQKPGIQKIVDTLMLENTDLISEEEIIEQCLEHLGYLEISNQTRDVLVEYAKEIDNPVKKITGIIRLITTSKEFQLA